ncbi:ecto-NOX disulfide-thiol exchanger 2 isoform X2 [Amyelois transitella]|uniref:ecto-NOX disulfide-thiol exchanger 2 isoform X2 n=1 Tax=Amyelois transitella TaxID=680683 RepID=UPI00067DB905|nr:ecto-NOX disulfide-thiol exchanger 2 isoform X2 [Amyelois transitella]
MMVGNRRDRSRSPTRVDTVGRRRDSKNHDGNKQSVDNNMANANVINPMMMQNMYQQGNMMMGGMYPNMMMGNMMGGGIMPTTGMEMMPSSMGTGMSTGMAPSMGANMGSGMDMMQQTPMEMGSIAAPIPAPPLPPGPTPIDMGMMGGMMMDPSMINMYPNMGGDMTPMQEKKEIILKHCKLTPPAVGSAPPPRRARPPGCRTIFVGGLPEKIRESTVRDIFEPYGRIHTLRLSKKDFCHIRFDRESSVDAAMQLSGYRLKLISKDDKEEEEDTKATTGWLHVDYALSRDDQNEYERKQRQVMRQQQVQMQQLAQQEMARSSLGGGLGGNYRRSPSPVRIQPFSNAAIVQLNEKIKSEEHFASTIPTLISWLERGECSKKNANQFYSMIQATNSHIRRLFNEKMQAEDELQECRERVKNHIERVIDQLEQVAKVFSAAGHQRVWDHFTKPQRKNIETWQKMTQEFNSLKEEFLEKFFSEDNEFNNGFNNKSNQEMGSSDEVQQLMREKESLQFQLEAYKNEVDVIKSDAKKEMEKFKAQFIARQALQGVVEKNPPLPSPVVKPPPPPPLPDDVDSKVVLKETVEAGCGEAKLIGIMSAFLQVHPQGASLDYVVSYVRALFPHVTQATIHHVMQKHPDVFERSTTGVGVNIENRWFFCAFKKEEKS